MSVPFKLTIQRELADQNDLQRRVAYALEQFAGWQETRPIDRTGEQRFGEAMIRWRTADH